MDIDEQGEWKTKIDQLSQIEMARIFRFAAPGEYPFFNTDYKELCDYFINRFRKMGGMTPEISKEIGW